ncbi:MAG: DNA ligase [Methylotenera sp.]|uniref:DNA ligase n=1 Tax=Methylotenera sp. TaxID=2051956 RepID=UPI002489171E|nr:DNA ligase [Methylotenera sp.]MDI1309785.1 DNA ligase [Methylotenera sp.]
MKYIHRLLTFTIATMLLSALFVTQCIAKQNDSNVLLAQVYQRGIDVRQYLVSEKYDGVRAVWDGNKLHTRTGRVIAAPTWFTKGLPTTQLDGELWLGHGKFDALSGAVRKDVPIDEEWHGVSYMVFELPNATGTFNERAKRIVKIVKQANIPQLKAVKQYRINDEATLNKLLKQIVAQGGEGLMLHRADAAYITGRSDVLLKVKLLLDAEATVIAHTPGRGKYAGKLGALEVETPEGIRFKLGTGFSDVQRADPPKIGSTVTYTYRDITKTGKPRFASFLRVRNEQ